MSIAAGHSSDQEKMHKKSFHRRHDSGELDVFEAAGYFSGYNEALGHQGTFPQKVTREDRQAWRGGRMSLDMPMRNALNPAQSHGVVDKQITKEHKKYKQPSSPGGRLASFLNSLFNQTASKKKKSSKSTTQSMKDHHEEESSPGGGGRRKRRSSISHFRISTTTTDSKSLYSSSSSGFRTPPPSANTPTKSYKDLRSYSDHKQQLATLSAKTNHNNGHVKSIVSLHNEILDHKTSTDLAWLDDKYKFSNSEKNRKLLGNEKSNKEGIWADRYPSEEKEFRMFTNDQMDDDDGAESDSSSDLFELQNYDLGCCYSSGNLPVYETTNMESIKRGPPISNAIL